MVLHAPRTKVTDYGYKPGDAHLVANAQSKTIKAFDFEGKLLWEKPCLAMGQDPKWWVKGGDCPPGVWKLDESQIYDDYSRVGSNPAFDRTLRCYGWVSVDMYDLEGREDDNGRSGLMVHGGGSGAGWPGAWAPYQPLLPTLGCLRMHNKDLVDYLLPLLQNYATVFLSVYQDDQ